MDAFFAVHWEAVFQAILFSLVTEEKLLRRMT